MTLLLLLACAPKEAEIGLPPAPGHVTFLHTNDLHGHFQPEPADWLEGRPAIGGFVRLEQEIRATRAARPRGSLLVLDGGDILTGTPLTDLDVRGSKGGGMLDFLEAVDYDAWVVGNHEFDKGLDNLALLTDQSRTSVLSANLRTPDGAAPLLPRQTYSEVFERGDVRIGVIGVTTDSLAGLMNRKDFERLKLVDPAVAVGAEVKRLDPDTDLLVVLSHMGVDDDVELARRVKGIDLIVGGHSHTRLTAARRVEDTWIVQAGSYTRSLGVVDLVVEGDAIAKFDYQLRDLVPETATVPPSARIQGLVDEYAAQIDGYYGVRISSAPATLGRDYHHESGLGRWIADVVREAGGADVGLYNGGGLRADLASGDVTIGSIYGCFPFRNEVMRFEMDGKALQAVLLRNVIAEADGKRGFLPISGVRYTWRMRNGAPELVDVTVGGAPLDLGRAYVVATNSYVTEQWEKHIGVEPRNLQGLGFSDFDAAVEAAKRGPVKDPGDARAVKVE